MWSAILASAATIAAVLYIQGPIMALALTAVSSIALLIVVRASEHKSESTKPQAHARPLEVVEGNSEVGLLFPPLRKQAS